MSKFAVGEIAIGCNFSTGRDKYNGMECEIVGGFRERNIVGLNGEPCEPHMVACYEVVFADGKQICLKEKHLKKKQPPQELSTWEDVCVITGWYPNKVVENA